MSSKIVIPSLAPTKPTRLGKSAVLDALHTSSIDQQPAAPCSGLAGTPPSQCQSAFHPPNMGSQPTDAGRFPPAIDSGLGGLGPGWWAVLRVSLFQKTLNHKPQLYYQLQQSRASDCITVLGSRTWNRILTGRTQREMRMGGSKQPVLSFFKALDTKARCDYSSQLIKHLVMQGEISHTLRLSCCRYSCTVEWSGYLSQHGKGANAPSKTNAGQGSQGKNMRACCRSCATVDITNTASSSNSIMSA